jgi:FlaG/FlaF family flagellin (archaellin)
MSVLVIALIAFVIILAGLMITLLIKYLTCQKKTTALQVLYDNDTKPLQFQLQDYKFKVLELGETNTNNTKDLDASKARISLLEKNIIGKFENNVLTNTKNSCVTVADGTKGDFTLLTLNKNCTNPIQSAVYSYDPVYKLVSVQHGDSKLCVDALNENDVVLNDCLKTSLKQKFNYFPLNGGRFQSTLYSKCLGYNDTSEMIELQKCGESSNIHTVSEQQPNHLYLENNEILLGV